MPNWGTAIRPIQGRRWDEEAAMGSNKLDIVKRLRRIEGQVTGIRKMQEDRRYCIDVLDQISAARAGLEATALLILEDHVNGCVREAIEEGKGEEKAAELLEAVGRFARSV
jgi:CsoR family transcriptional regulator, copper-sensing transcriptional repressor